jgi:tetratricopeptide (TPR) repeat protein
MINKFIVFISSTADLTTYRNAAESVLRALEIEGSRFEAWPSVPNPSGPMDECLARIREADAVVLVLGEKYGTVIEDGLSATHTEYRHARTHRKPVFAFVLECPRRDDAQAAFIKEIEKEFFRSRTIRTVSEFEGQLKNSLLQEFTRCFRHVHGGPPNVARFALPPPVTSPSGPALFLSDDSKAAFLHLRGLYESGQDARIRELATQIALKFIDVPAIINVLYMAEVNLAMSGATPDTGRLDAAIRFWDDPQVKRRFASYSLAYNQGNALGALNRFPEAIARYEAALAEKPDFAECWKNLGTAYVDSGDPAAARRCFEKAVAFCSGLFEARYSLATMAAGDHAFEEALAHLAMIRIDHLPPVQRSWVCGRQAMSLSRLGNHKEAIAAIEAAIGLVPDTDWPWEFAARIYALARRADRRWLDDARHFGERFVSRVPARGDAWGELGYTYWKLRLENTTEEWSRKCIAAFGRALECGFLDHGLIADRLGHVYLDRDEPEKAVAAFRVAVEQDAASFGYCLGVSLMKTRCYDEALCLLTDAAQKHQPDALSWGNVAVCYERTGRDAEAVAAYEKSIQLDPTYALSWFNLGGLHWNAGDTSEAIRVWREALERFPDHPLAVNVRTILD